MSGRVDVRKAIHDALNVLAELDHSFDEFAALSEAHAAVAELIEAGKELIGKRGAVMALGSNDPRWVRYVAALAAIGGAK